METQQTVDKSRRSSAFLEIGLEGTDTIVDNKLRNERPKLQARFRSNVSLVDSYAIESEPPTPIVTPIPSPPTTASNLISRIPFLQIALMIALLAIAFPTFYVPLADSRQTPPMAQAGVIVPRPRAPAAIAAKRQTTSTDVCKRWSGQSALVNGTLYYYGGRATTSADQTSNEWNNDFLSLDLTQSWQIGSPSLTGLPTPSGPPAVSLGYLWSSTDNLYLYGGEFSDTPAASPVPFALWSYNIKSTSWTQHSNPTFPDGSPVQRAAEGAGVSVPNLGLGYYFGGHLDGYTTAGWSQSIARVYLPSMVEYTMPGFSNSALQSNSPTSADGAYRNITVGSAGFPERADGVLVYIPNYSKSGIIVGLAGGTNQSFTQMNVIDVYDIATSTWYKQATSGPTPDVRVNPCAVAATSADGSSTQIYMYGGQNLVPYDQQTQYNDMWVLTVPSFTWIQVNTSGQSVPPARAGHTCNIWNGQMVVVGGYVGQTLSCDSPGIYVFNTSSLQWQNSYTALADTDSLNRQKAQAKDPNALQGSFGYQVPAAVQSVIGGNSVGSATVTAPAESATGGPLATGGPATYTVTGTNGAVTTETSKPAATTGTANSGNSAGGSNVGAIVAGVIAGLLFVIACYLGFCAWVYRKQIKLYKNHMDMAQRSQLNSSNGSNPFGLAAMIQKKGRTSSEKGKSPPDSDRYSSDNRSGGSSEGRRQRLASNNPYLHVPGGTGYATAASSTEDLMRGMEPSFLGVLLSPRRSLRVVNKD